MAGVALSTNPATRTDDAELQTVRGALHHLSLTPDAPEVRVSLRGIVLRRWSRPPTAGCEIEDLTGPATIADNRDSKGNPHRHVAVGMRIWVTGRARLGPSGSLVVRPTYFRLISGQSRDRGQDHSSIPAHVIDSFVLAKLRAVSSSVAEQNGFRQFEPYYLGLLGDSPHDSALRVTFPGWGADAALATSPGNQLLEALLATAEERVFAIARCFSYAYRDGVTSAESLTLVARGLDLTVEDAASFVQEIVNAIMSDGDTTIGSALVSESSGLRRNTPAFALDGVEKAYIQVEQFTSGGKDGDAFAIVLPPGITVAEGDVTKWENGIQIAGISVHLERILSILSARRLSQLRNLETYRGGTGQ